MAQSQLPTHVIAGITVPDTPLITKSIALARKYLDDQGYKHVMRSWLSGQASINRLPVSERSSIDEEAFSIATILHDLGWSTSSDMISKDKQFEVDGANAAREFLLREGKPEEWDKHRVQLVWDSIAFHTCPIAPYKEAEVAHCNAGIVTELFGIEVAKTRLGGTVRITQEELDAIWKEYPREGLRGYLREILCGFCRTKPEVTYGTFVSGYGDRFVEGYSSEGKQMVDLMEALITE